jgi:hypothetical protein
MCFAAKAQKVAAPAAPAETLQQPVPDKKTDTASAPTTDSGEKVSTIADPTNPTSTLAIGTKKYRNDSGLGSAGLTIAGAPTGIPLAT